MAEDQLLWLTHPECGRHEMGSGHPERPERLAAVEAAVAQSPLAAQRILRESGRAAEAALRRVHEAAYVENMLAAAPAQGYLQLDPDTALNAHSTEAALRAAGAALDGVAHALRPGGGLAFCAVRPPGHHAERSNAMGFCLFDNVAVAAAEALAQGLDRVAILDFDVHYGNGTVDIFRKDPRVLVCNTYQYPLYPYWRDGGGAAHIVDTPLAPGADSQDFRDAVSRTWAPALDRFQPQLILVSAGFDAHRDDPLAQLELVEADYAWIGTRIRDWAERHAEGRVVATLEGGYRLSALAASVTAFLGGLLGTEAAAA